MKNTCAWLAVATATSLAACGGGSSGSDEIPLTVSKASCGASDNPETALQGQVPAAMRTVGGFKGFNCNLELAGQHRGDGASWTAATFRDGTGRKCGYYGTSIETANRTQRGSVVADVSNATAPAPTMYLTTASMIDPWESLKVNPRRQLLGAVNSGAGGLRGGPEIDLYDLSGDCRRPQLLSTFAVGKDAANGQVVEDVLGHEGDFAPDGLTYYGSDIYHRKYYAVDISNTTQPKLLGSFTNPNAPFGVEANGRGDPTVHGLSLSDDGNRAYFVSLAGLSTRPNATYLDANIPAMNGLMIVDTSEIQARKANPQMRLVGELYWKDGSVAQHTIPVKIGGKPHLVFVDEGGSGVLNEAGWKKACAAGMPPWGVARIIDISDETKPRIVSRLLLETNDTKNCDKVLPDVVGLAGFTYDSHYCAVDDKADTTTLACGYSESGIRVFDVRDPARPREVAYFNPPSVTTPSPGSQNNRVAATGRPDHCMTPVNLDKATATLWTACQDNGLLSLKFTNGVWPFQ
jgi:hypothetical protein